jgi:hypothetical protein
MLDLTKPVCNISINEPAEPEHDDGNDAKTLYLEG